MFTTSYDVLHMIEPTLYSHCKLGTKPLDIDVLIIIFSLVRVHQLYSFERFYERGEKDMSNTNSVHQKRTGLPCRHHCQVCLSMSLLVY